MLRKILIVSVSWLALGVAFPDSSFAGRVGGLGGGGGIHSFGGFGGGGGIGGIHSFGGFGGVRSFGAPSIARAPMHFGAVRNFGAFSHRSFGFRHFGHARFAHNFRATRHVAHIAHNRFAHNRALHNEHVLHNEQALHNEHVLHNEHALRNEGVNRFANRTQLANAGAKGNAFTNAKWGGHEWSHHGFRRFWAGGVFWPYFFGDYFSYAFWPYDYYDDFWDWGPDVLLWGAFWPDYYYPYWDYSYYGAGYPAGYYAGDIYSRYRHYAAAPQPPERIAAVGQQEAAATCAGFAPGVDNLPLQRIEEIVKPAPDQRQAFDELKAAMAKASDVLSQACPAQTPLTPVARLDAMQQRLTGMLQAEEIVRGPLERLYRSLSPEQKQRLDSAVASGQPQGRKVDLAKLCSSQAGFTNVPEQDIARTITLDPRQKEDLDALRQVSDQAARMLSDSCPASVPSTLEGRLDGAEARLHALIRAIDTIRPKVQTFFASLSPAQRSALNSEAPRTQIASRRH